MPLGGMKIDDYADQESNQTNLHGNVPASLFPARDVRQRKLGREPQQALEELRRHHAWNGRVQLETY